MSGATAPDGTAPEAPVAVHLVGVGPGPVDLLTVRASRLIAMSGTCLHARGEEPPGALALCPPTARVVDTASLSTGQILDEIRAALSRGDRVVHLFAGDPLQHDETPTLTEVFDAADHLGTRPRHPTPAHTTRQASWRVRYAGRRPGRTVWRTEPASPTPGDPGRSSFWVVPARPAGSRTCWSPPAGRGDLVGGQTPGTNTRGEVRIGGSVGPRSCPLAGELGERTDRCGRPVRRKISVDAPTPPLRPACLFCDWSAPNGRKRPGTSGFVSRTCRPRWRWSTALPPPMLTVGKHGASAFAGDERGSYLIRCSEPPPGPLPQRYLLVLDRGPFGVDAERTLMARHRIDVLVTRDSGGESTAAKLEAARALHIPVVMVDRPQHFYTEVETSRRPCTPCRTRHAGGQSVRLAVTPVVGRRPAAPWPVRLRPAAARGGARFRSRGPRAQGEVASNTCPSGPDPHDLLAMPSVSSWRPMTRSAEMVLGRSTAPRNSASRAGTTVGHDRQEGDEPVEGVDPPHRWHLPAPGGGAGSGRFGGVVSGGR